MKRLIVLGAIFLAACSSSSVKDEAMTSGIHDIPIQYKLRDYQVETLPNGLKIYTIENHTLPSFGIGLMLKSGATIDPMAKSGLMAMMALVMEKGTKQMSATQIADELGHFGSDFQQTVTDDFSWFQTTGLSLHQMRLLEIFSQIILSPSFPEKDLDRERKNVLAGLTKLIDYPDRFASEAFDSYLFGSHPYSRPVSGIARDVKTISRNDLERIYTQVMRPNNAIMIVSGDVSSEFKKQVRAVFSKWQKKEVPAPIMQAPPAIKGIQLRLVEKADVTQSQFLMGQISIKRSDPDFMKLRLANQALGGGLSSRLMDEIRVNRGYTYGIGSQIDARLDRGPFLVSSSTRVETTGPLISETLKVVDAFIKKGITQEELDAGKSFLLGNFTKAIETPQKLGMNLAILDFYGLSDDYLRNFARNLGVITLDDVNKAITKHFSEAFKILVLGPPTLIETLRPFGPVEVRKPNQIF